MLAALFLIFCVVPTESEMGIVQRIFYFHVPCAFTAYAGFLTVAVSVCLSPAAWGQRALSSAEIQQIVQQVMALGVQDRVMVLAPIVRGRKGEYRKDLEKLARQGFVRARIDEADPPRRMDLGDPEPLRRPERLRERSGELRRRGEL